MESICYKELEKAEINIDLFKNFNRYQDVRKCWRKENDKWILKDIAFIEQWGLEALQYNAKLHDAEPYDCQLEYSLEKSY